MGKRAIQTDDRETSRMEQLKRGRSPTPRPPLEELMDEEFPSLIDSKKIALVSMEHPEVLAYPMPCIQGRLLDAVLMDDCAKLPTRDVLRMVVTAPEECFEPVTLEAGSAIVTPLMFGEPTLSYGSPLAAIVSAAFIEPVFHDARVVEAVISRSTGRDHGLIMASLAHSLLFWLAELGIDPTTYGDFQIPLQDDADLEAYDIAMKTVFQDADTARFTRGDRIRAVAAMKRYISDMMPCKYLLPRLYSYLRRSTRSSE